MQLLLADPMEPEQPKHQVHVAHPVNPVGPIHLTHRQKSRKIYRLYALIIILIIAVVASALYLGQQNKTVIVVNSCTGANCGASLFGANATKECISAGEPFYPANRTVTVANFTKGFSSDSCTFTYNQSASILSITCPQRVGSYPGSRLSFGVSPCPGYTTTTTTTIITTSTSTSTPTSTTTAQSTTTVNTTNTILAVGPVTPPKQYADEPSYHNVTVLINSTGGSGGVPYTSYGLPYYTYYWYQNFNGSVWSKLSLPNKQYYYFVINSSIPNGTYGFKLRAIDQLGNSANSSVGYVQVNKTLTAPLLEAYSMQVGIPGAVTITATLPETGTPPYSYVWQVSTNSTANYTTASAYCNPATGTGQVKNAVVTCDFTTDASESPGTYYLKLRITDFVNSYVGSRPAQITAR